MRPIVLRWPGGEHSFRLGLADMQVIQQKTDCGPEYLFHRIVAGQWRDDDLIEVLRNGLIGGGMPAEQAGPLVRNRYDSADGILAFKEAAAAVLGAYVYGPPDDPVGESIPVGQAPGKQKTASGNSAPSTA